MIKTKLTWTVKQIQQMFQEKKTLAFDHPIQRQGNQWGQEMKSLLVHSLLSGYPIPNIYVLREDSTQVDEKNKPIYNFSVIDGKQRLTNVLSFLNGDYSLSEELPTVEIDGVTYKLGGLYFGDLDEPVKYEILRFKFDIFSFEDCSDDEIEEIFFRLNNSVPLSKSQISKAKMGTTMAEFINELLKSKFMSESGNFSASQRKSNDDQKCIIQGMMLLDKKYASYELVDFSETSIMSYSESVKNNYSNKQQNIILSAIQYLNDAFPTSNKSLRKISIPILIYLADFSMDNDKKPIFFRQWYQWFIDEDELQEDYKTYCSTGSTKLEKVLGRVKTMMLSFCKYFELEIPEEYQEQIDNSVEGEEAEATKQLFENVEENIISEEATDLTDNLQSQEDDISCIIEDIGQDISDTYSSEMEMVNSNIETLDSITEHLDTELLIE